MNLIKKYSVLILNIFFIFLISNTSLANNIKNSAVILMYHKFDTPKYPSTNVTLNQLNSHLEEFSKPKYSVLS